MPTEPLMPSRLEAVAGLAKENTWRQRNHAIIRTRCCLARLLIAAFCQYTSAQNPLDRITEELASVDKQIGHLRSQMNPLLKRVFTYEKRLRAATARDTQALASVRSTKFLMDDAREAVDKIRIGLQAEVEGNPRMLAHKRAWNDARIIMENRRAEILETVHQSDAFMQASTKMLKMNAFVDFLQANEGFSDEEIQAAQTEARRLEEARTALERNALDSDESFSQALVATETAFAKIQAMRAAAPKVGVDDTYRDAVNEYIALRQRHLDAQAHQRDTKAAVASANAAYHDAPDAVREAHKELLVLRKNLTRLTTQRVLLLQQKHELAPPAPKKPGKKRRGKKRKKN